MTDKESNKKGVAKAMPGIVDLSECNSNESTGTYGGKICAVRKKRIIGRRI